MGVLQWEEGSCFLFYSTTILFSILVGSSSIYCRCSILVRVYVPTVVVGKTDKLSLPE